MFLMNCFRKASIGLAFLPYLLVILHLAQVTPVDARWQCMPHFDDQVGQQTAICWVSEQKKVLCQKNSCVPFYNQNRPFGSLTFVGCENSKAGKTGVTVSNLRNYHHYPNGDEQNGHKGYVAVFDGISKLWYNCAYDGYPDNMNVYICSSCK
ncbi:hypothetical protein PGTUg99_031219 [Puccinia graminis f. sp. tritici]|uniref:Secreted protein n=1 Tax=Puccinia graminis f. sp. tritici TaxID=56615 RepID=A0A5B0SDF9_PUCGR|nr:hypothetical protein PGTUg99_031219 [Puccinia graminis f. sp. tritici]